MLPLCQHSYPVGIGCLMLDSKLLAAWHSLDVLAAGEAYIMLYSYIVAFDHLTCVISYVHVPIDIYT